MFLKLEEINMRDAFGKYLHNIGDKYKDMVVLDCDLSTSTRTNLFAKKYPKRFFNMGIAEQNMLGTAMGFAISGKIPIVSGFSIFTSGRAWEFIRMACHDNLNVKIITTHGGIVGEDGSTHNALEDLSIMATLPNLNVLIPVDNLELVQMLDFALKNEGPFYIRIPRESSTNVHNKNYHFTMRKPDVVKKGKDICFIGTGYGTILSLKSALEIENELNCTVKVINLSTIKPIDEEKLINEVKNVKGVIIIEEHNIYCGVGSIVARIFSERYPIKMKIIGVDNSYCQSGTRNEVLKEYGLNIENIIEKAKNLLS